MTPIELKEMLAEIKSEIPEIMKTISLIDDSDLSDFAAEMMTSEMVLVGVIPSYEHVGKIGAFKTLPIFQLDIVEKTDYSAINNDEYVALYDRTLRIMFKVRNFVLEKIEEGCYPMLSNIDVTSMTIDPVKKKAQCNGWSMDILTE